MGCTAKFLVADFRVFQRKRHLLEMVNRKKNYSGILNSFDSAKPEITAKKLCFEYKLLFILATSERKAQNIIQVMDFLGNFRVSLGIQHPKKYRFDCEFVLKYYSN